MARALAHARRATARTAAGTGAAASPSCSAGCSARGSLIIVLIVVLGVGLGLGGWWLTTGRYAQVPSVSGDRVAQATTALTADGFTVKRARGCTATTCHSGPVVGTSPAGRVAKGSTITILVSAGPFTSVVPEVQTTRSPPAEAALAARTPESTIQKVGSDAPVGTVLGTNPAAGTTWPQTKPVAILVAGGPPLPNFVGRTCRPPSSGPISTASTCSSSRTRTASSRRARSPASSPRPGRCTGRARPYRQRFQRVPAEVNVPDVIGLSVQQATQALQAAGFQVQVQHTARATRVFDYSPVGQAPRAAPSSSTSLPGSNRRLLDSAASLTGIALALRSCASSSGFGLATGPGPGRSPARPCADGSDLARAPGRAARGFSLSLKTGGGRDGRGDGGGGRGNGSRRDRRPGAGGGRRRVRQPGRIPDDRRPGRRHRPAGHAEPARHARGQRRGADHRAVQAGEPGASPGAFGDQGGGACRSARTR